MYIRWNIEKAKQLFLDSGCELLECEYVNTNTKMRYIASCGHEHESSLTNFKAGKGRLCKLCRWKSVGNKNRLSFKEVESYFSQAGCNLVSKEYVRNNIKLEYVAQCRHVNYMDFSKFQGGGGRVCARCSKSILYEYADAVQAFEERGCHLLEKEYINCKTKMRFIAKCGHEHMLTLDELKNSNASTMCLECQKVKSYNISNVREIFQNEGCEVLSKRYIPKGKIRYIANCGHEHSIKLLKFVGGQGRECPKCSRPKGEDHHKYNPNLTDEERIDKRDVFEVILWRRKVYERDQYTCECCGDDSGGNLNAHHLNGYNWDIENRFNIDNGITLCDICHKVFHLEFGYGNNTREQFNKWVWLQNN